MSHFTTIQTQFKDAEALVAALKEFCGWQAQIYEEAQPLIDYYGRPTRQAHVIVRRGSPKYHYNADLGFERDEEGNLQLIADEMYLDRSFVSQLQQAYAEQVTLNYAQKHNLAVIRRERLKDGRVQIELAARQQVVRRK